MAYKCRGNLQGKVKAVEMAANDFSLVTLSAKFADKAGGPVALQYKGRTLASDADVKEALDDCYAQKKLFLEVDLRLGGAAMASQAPAAQAQAVAKKEPVRSVPVSAPAQQPSSSSTQTADAAAASLLSKYGLSGQTSPRNNAPATSGSGATSPRGASAQPTGRVLAAASAAPAVARQQEAPAARPVERAYAAPAAAPARQPVERVVAAPAPVNPQRSGASRDRPLRGGAEAEFRHHINRLRSQPSEYAALIGDRAKCYEGNILRLKRGTTMFKSQTHEGARACTEAQRYMSSVSSAHELAFPFGLSEAAREIVQFMGPEDRRPTPNDLAAIIARNGEYEGTLSQVIAYLYEDDVQASVLDLLVCDGDSSRHTAKLLMNPQYKYGGVAVGDAKPGQPRLVVMQFVSESWTELQ